MKAEELRINNLVSRTNKLTKENSIIELTASCILDIHANGEMSSFIYEPILLTEEWLLKFGFEQSLIDKKLYKYMNFIFFKLEYEYTNSIDFDYISANLRGTNAGSFMCRLYFAHQLQNLYYALTQTALTLKK